MVRWETVSAPGLASPLPTFVCKGSQCSSQMSSPRVTDSRHGIPSGMSWWASEMYTFRIHRSIIKPTEKEHFIFYSFLFLDIRPREERVERYTCATEVGKAPGHRKQNVMPLRTCNG